MPQCQSRSKAPPSGPWVRHRTHWPTRPVSALNRYGLRLRDCPPRTADARYESEWRVRLNRGCDAEREREPAMSWSATSTATLHPHSGPHQTLALSVSGSRMFRTMRNDARPETLLLEDAIRQVRELLPRAWTANLTGAAPYAGDVLLSVRGPAGVGVTYRVEAKRAGGRSLADTVAALRERQRETGFPVLFVADYIGPATRRALAQAGISYVDATGWVRLVSDDPLILLTGEGAERSPRAPESSAVVRLNGVATGRVIRALSEVEVPVGVRELASAAQVSPGSVSKLLTTLAAEGIVDRDARGAVSNVRRRSLLRRWAQDYGYATTNPGLGYWLAPRGLAQVIDRVAEQEGVAVTGSAAVRRLLPPDKTSVVPLRLLALYAASPRRLAEQLGLVEADAATANVVIAAPQDGRILPSPGEPATLAPTALVVADLLTLPGRSDAEAEQLMDALTAIDPSWKE